MAYRKSRSRRSGSSYSLGRRRTAGRRVRRSVGRGSGKRGGVQTLRIVVHQQPASSVGAGPVIDPTGESMGVVPTAPRKARF
jgi:hypothetical protein